MKRKKEQEFGEISYQRLKISSHEPLLGSKKKIEAAQKEKK